MMFRSMNNITTRKEYFWIQLVLVIVQLIRMGKKYALKIVRNEWT